MVSLPPIVSVAPPATVTTGFVPDRRPADPSVSVPEVRPTLVAAAVPPRLDVPVDVRLPAPRLAPAAVVPKASA